MVDPLPMLPGATTVSLLATPVRAPGWRAGDGKFVCRVCESPAFLHPQTNWIWGCKKCGFVTANPAVYFKPVAS